MEVLTALDPGRVRVRNWKVCLVGPVALMMLACGTSKDGPAEWRLPKLSEEEAGHFNAPGKDGTCSIGSPYSVERGDVRYTLVLDGGLSLGSPYLGAVTDDCGNWLVLYQRTESYFAAHPSEWSGGTEYSQATLLKVFPTGLFAWERNMPTTWETPVERGTASQVAAGLVAPGSRGVAAVVTEVTVENDVGESTTRHPLEFYLANGSVIEATSDLNLEHTGGPLLLDEDQDSGGWWLQGGGNGRGALLQGPSFEPRYDADWAIRAEELDLPRVERRIDLIALEDGGRAFLGIARLDEYPAYVRVEGEEENDDVQRLYVTRLVAPDRVRDLLGTNAVSEGIAHLIALQAENVQSCRPWGSLAAHGDRVFAGYGCEVYDSEQPDGEQFSWWFRVSAFDGLEKAWEWNVPGGLRLTRIVALPDDRLLVIGARAMEENSEGTLSLSVLDAGGEVVWTRNYNDDSNVPQTWEWSVSSAPLTPDGHVLVGATLDSYNSVAGPTRHYWVGEIRWAD